MNGLYGRLQVRCWLISLILVFGGGALWDYLETRDASLDLLGAGWEALKLYFIAGIALILLSTVTIALYLAIFSDEALVKEVVLDMRFHRLPARKSGDLPGIIYLSIIMDDKNADVEDRVSAAKFYSKYENISEGYRRFGTAALRRVIQKAVREYSEMNGTA